ncbi:MAG: sigma 54-interacting transcriptional regulator [Deltaproteobacteria bacterium]|jgi:arginine utilization regulatory protein|nr:sigma 54-interacting transcriptional regulator [Deltaproteobacteria bacterium]
MKKYFYPDLLHPESNFNSILDSLPHGVIITDSRGVITFYSKVQGEIDGLAKEEALGHHITEVYVPHPDASPILLSMRLGQPIHDLFEIYETRKGRVVNSTHTVLPLIKSGKVRGCICLVYPLDAKPGPPRTSQAARNAFLFGKLIGSSPSFLESITRALAAANSPSSVLIYGETGSGKEILARQLHDQSQRASCPFVAINCSAIPANLLEGLMFGSIKGAFTGARDASGLFEEADGGTVYLDEIDSMPLELQPKLLRFIQERRVRRLGAFGEKDVDIKIISSFSREPLEAVRAGRVRADLFYRLGVVMVRIPPLRERMSDLTSLITFFINKHQAKLGKMAPGVSPEAMDLFKLHGWPGNVRELENVIEGALNVVHDGETIGIAHLPQYFRPTEAAPVQAPWPAAPIPAWPWGTLPPPAPPGGRAGRPGRGEIIEALTQTRGSLKDASCLLGISRQLLAYRLKKYNLSRRQFDV